MQNLSSVAPPPLAGEAAEVTLDMPTLVPPESQRQPLRTLGLVMVIGGAFGLALVLMLRPGAPAPKQVTAPPALPAPPIAPLVETPSAPAEPAVTTKQSARSKRASKRAEARESAPAVSQELSIRIRARVAPVRATPDQDGKVLCSVKRGAVMRSFEQRPGAKARWFAVHCDKDSSGWLHENFLTPMRP